VNTILTDDQKAKLLANGRVSAERGGPQNHWPVIKLFVPNTRCVWLVTEIDPADQSVGFGLCDLGQGTPEMGSIDLAELVDPADPLAKPDPKFQAQHPLFVYFKAAHAHRRIVETADVLAQFAKG